ncbi:MAG: Zn-dependent hydrolase [Frankiales bacterium]|jgi:glyoxylase-like metal-dependent hydrolase (beta-lactamase superfamily II)|nr:Zn-dependent hydrolase [Frankiales bacterium]MCW2585811.1 Zn-dependent hydrolase [Frankiales bacterium]
MRIESLVTTGQLEEDGISRVVNNVWVVGNDEEVLVLDPAHDVDAIQYVVRDRRVVLIACTHGHSDHINRAVELSTATGAPVLLHPADHDLWHETYPDRPADEELVGGRVLRFAGLNLRVIETPGHTRGSVSLYEPALEAVFAGDAAYLGGAAGVMHAELHLLTREVHDRIASLPPQTRILPGHGVESTVAEQVPRTAETRGS